MLNVINTLESRYFRANRARRIAYAIGGGAAFLLLTFSLNVATICLHRLYLGLPIHW